jgi:hypothetical protein
MTKDDIIKLAQEAGFADSEGVVHAAYQLEAFANLVAAAEREACAKVCEEHQFSSIGLAAAIRARGNT